MRRSDIHSVRTANPHHNLPLQNVSTLYWLSIFARTNFFYIGDFKVVAGETKVYTHISDVSGLALYVNFCANCGTKLFQTFERFPEALGVFGGTFDEPDWFTRNPDNTRHIFVDSAVKGDILPADYMLYHQHTADANSGEKLEPFKLDEHQQVE